MCSFEQLYEGSSPSCECVKPEISLDYVLSCSIFEIRPWFLNLELVILASLAGQQAPGLCLSLLHPEQARLGPHILLFSYSVLSIFCVPCCEVPHFPSQAIVVAKRCHGLTLWGHVHCTTVWKILASFQVSNTGRFWVFVFEIGYYYVALVQNLLHRTGQIQNHRPPLVSAF